MGNVSGYEARVGSGPENSDYMITHTWPMKAEALLTLNNYDVAMPVPEKRSRGRGLYTSVGIVPRLSNVGQRRGDVKPCEGVMVGDVIPCANFVLWLTAMTFAYVLATYVVVYVMYTR